MHAHNAAHGTRTVECTSWTLTEPGKVSITSMDTPEKRLKSGCVRWLRWKLLLVISRLRNSIDTQNLAEVFFQKQPQMVRIRENCSITASSSGNVAVICASKLSAPARAVTILSPHTLNRAIAGLWSNLSFGYCARYRDEKPKPFCILPLRLLLSNQRQLSRRSCNRKIFEEIIKDP